MTVARHLRSNSFVHKILTGTRCGPTITSLFLSKTMIPIVHGIGGRPTPRPKFSFRGRAISLASFALALIFSASLASAQAQRGTLVHEETIRVSPSGDAAKLGEAGRGHELVIIETSRDWTHVEAILREPKKNADEDDPESEAKT